MDEVKEKPVSETGTGNDRQRELILFNDEVNTFDHVIQCLMEICRHTQEQAEQCALIAHYKGKCAVKSGSLDELKPLSEAMTVQQLSVTIK